LENGNSGATVLAVIIVKTADSDSVNLGSNPSFPT